MLRPITKPLGSGCGTLLGAATTGEDGGLAELGEELPTGALEITGGATGTWIGAGTITACCGGTIGTIDGGTVITTSVLNLSPSGSSLTILW